MRPIDQIMKPLRSSPPQRSPDLYLLHCHRLLTAVTTLLVSSLIFLPVAISSAADPSWIPSRSEDFATHVRRVEESLETGVEIQILDSIALLAERLVDGDPGGSTPLGGGLSVGAGPYLRGTVARLESPLRDRVIDEIRLRTLSRISESPLPGFDNAADRKRTSILMDLPHGSYSEPLARSLAESALERGDIDSWKRSVEMSWIEDPGHITLPALIDPVGPTITTGSVLIPAYSSTRYESADTSETPWRST
ncbi:MAG: hypothetical protein AAEJ04_03275, partial [Planctomycetota bacterium]